MVGVEPRPMEIEFTRGAACAVSCAWAAVAVTASAAAAARIVRECVIKRAPCREGDCVSGERVRYAPPQAIPVPGRRMSNAWIPIVFCRNPLPPAAHPALMRRIGNTCPPGETPRVTFAGRRGGRWRGRCPIFLHLPTNDGRPSDRRFGRCDTTGDT